MGMAASQCNFGALTRRKHDIGRALEDCAIRETSLTREMRGVTLKYQNALNTKTLKWSNNSGVTCVDLSYANLMKPSNANQNKPYLITNTFGQVVVDDKYKEYAEMISPEGKAGGDWESNRVKILASLIPNLSEEQINNSVTASNTANTTAQKVEKLRNEADILYSKCTQKKCDKEFVAECFGSVSGFGATGNVANDYKNDKAQWSLGKNASGAKTQVKELLRQITENVSKHLSDKDLEAFNKAVEKMNTVYSNYVESADEKNTNLPMSINSKNKNYVINASTFVKDLLDIYRENGGRATQGEHNSSTYYYSYINRDSEAYRLYEAKQKEFEDAKKELNVAVDNDNKSLTAEQESSIKFYDQLFSAIAEKGWNYNAQINDNEYINNMLQNNQFYITTMEAKTDDKGKNYYEYEESLASNFDNIIKVNDKDAQEEALVQYEYEKSIINEKEQRNDARRTDLETELSSINKMMEGIKTVRNDNIERTFSTEA